MDELYEEWLLTTCDLDREKAARVRARYPRIDDLADATPEAIAESCVLSLEEATAVRAKASESISIGDRWYSNKAELFICPVCGAFASADSETCPQCGTEFEEEEEGAPAPAAEPAKEVSEQPALYICSNCGASLSKDAESCSTCHQVIEEAEAVEEELPREVVTQVEKEEVKVCPHCGAFLAPGAERCGICGYSSAEETVPGEVPAPEIKESKGVSQDFLARWQRVAEKTPTRADQLGEELRHYEELLEVDPKLERAWVLKSHVLRELGRPKEAVQCLERAAKINPARDEEYRLQVLNLAETLADSSLIPPRWSAMAPPEKPAAEISAIQKALSYYERLLRSDSRLDVAWETRAELLQRLGRNEEADTSRARAKDVRRMKMEGERKALDGLRTVGVPRAKGTPREGRVNGLVNGIGRTNGLVNGLGRTNGLVNGIGRTNGLVNGLGRTNGLVNGIGRTNGLVNGLGRVYGLVNGIGHVNGLVNGNGFTNGRRGRFQPIYRAERGWFRSAGVVAAVIAILLLAPLIATLIPSGPQTTILRVDGSFSDWAGIPTHDDAVGDTRGANVSYRSDLDIVSTKVSSQDGQLAVYVEVDGVMFDTPSAPAAPDLIDYVLIMVDADGRPSTGYSIGGIGADMEVLISGYDGKMAGSRVSDWNPGLGGGQNNLSAFSHRDAISAAASGSMLEFMMPLAEPSEAHIIVLTANTTGVIDIADDVACVAYSTLAVTQRTLVSDIMTVDDQAFLYVRLRAEAGSSTIHAVNVTKQGSMPDQSVVLSLHLDDNDGTYEPADTLLNTSSFISGIGSLGVDLTIREGESVSLFVVAHLSTAPDASSLTLKVSAISTNSLVDLRDSIISGTYYRQAPKVTIDGVFGDWDAAKVQRDGLWDVRSSGGLESINTNVDIAEVGLNVTADFAFYMKVQGRMLGGEDLPNLRERPIPAQFTDADGDTVPDSMDSLPDDFNNDGTPDSQSNGDVDADGVLDYPAGSDFWLNATIPSYFPAPYAGRIVSRYLGPFSYNVPTGMDTAFAYVDADNSTATGLYTEIEGQVYGVDYALVANGRQGQLNNASLFRYRPNANVPFEWMGNVAAAIDSGRLEMAANATVFGLMPGFRVIVYMTDWLRDTDSVSPLLTRGGRYGVRSPAGDNVVINEIYPQKGAAWVELANPTSSPVALSGWRLQIIKGNKYITIYTFTTEIIGSWLSGAEYLSVNLPSGDLPGSNGNIILRDSANTIVDATTYPSISTTQTWARFKAASDGKPVDTDANSDWYVSSIPTRGGPNDRYRPIIRVVKTLNVLIAGPGDYVQYTVYYNNTGDAVSRAVWINDTLPAGVTFYSSSVPPFSWSGNTYRWRFANVPAGAPRSFTIIAQVNGNAQDSTLQVNTVFGNYTDQLGRWMERSVSWANFTCRRPTIKVEKTASPSVTVPGAIVTYTIYFNNTGSANALRVWINDTLPTDVTYLGASVAPSSWSGQTYRWIFANVGPGAHSFTITVQIKNPAQNSILVNWVFLNYTSQSGYKLSESKASATVIIPEFQDVIIPIAIPLFIFAGQRFLSRKRNKREAVADSVPPTNGR